MQLGKEMESIVDLKIAVAAEHIGLVVAVKDVRHRVADTVGIERIRVGYCSRVSVERWVMPFAAAVPPTTFQSWYTGRVGSHAVASPIEPSSVKVLRT